MSNKGVTVLAPNGRRQNIKVTPNTTILQILEMVCEKQGYNPEDYDLTHHNKVVDATAPLRFTGLPNNAQLEMALATRIRREANVKVGLTLESGERLIGEFEPSETLWGVVTALCPDEKNNEEVPSVVYMGREVNGEADLQETTLRSLGLTKGGAVLRFFKRSPGHINQQANVSAPLRRPPIVASDHPKKKHVSVVQPASPSIPHQSDQPEVSTDQPAVDQPQKSEVSTKEVQLKAPSPTEQNQSAVEEPPKSEVSTSSAKPTESTPMETADQSRTTDETKSESISEMEYEDSSSVTTSGGSGQSKPPAASCPIPNRNTDEEDEPIIILGERNAVVFNLSAVSGAVEDVPDDFFDLTLNDARQLLRDHKRRQAELEEAPLLTQPLRELHKSNYLLSQLNQYRRCVVRVQFPDRLVLQGMFTPLETFKAVMEFVRNHLQYPEADFHLFVTPPKSILPPEQTLVGAGCVPCTLIHFGYSSGVYDKYLRDDIASRITSPRGATIAARRARGLASSRPASAPVLSTPNTSINVAGPSNASSGNALPAQSSSDSGPISSTSTAVKRPVSDKVPKWFRTAGK